MARYTYPEDFDGTFWTIIDADYYVSTIGSDITGDGSPKSPFLTVKKAFEFALDGEKVIVGPDEYVTESAASLENFQEFGSELPCQLATTSSIDLFTGGLLEIDGVTAGSGDRVLVWQQSDAMENGIYLATNGTWLRANDFNSVENIIPGRIIPILKGDSYANSIFQNVTEGSVALGVTEIAFQTITGGQGSLSNGSGTTAQGNSVNLGGTLTEDLTISGENTNINITQNVAGNSSSNTIIGNEIEDNGAQYTAGLNTLSSKSDQLLSVSSDHRATSGGNGAISRVAQSLTSTSSEQGALLGIIANPETIHMSIQVTDDLQGNLTSLMEIRDGISNKGLEYAEDYSANYIDRSLVDKAFVDALVGVLSNLNTTDKSSLVNAINELKATVDAGGGSGGGGWLTSGTTTMQGDVTILNGNNNFTHLFEAETTTAGMRIQWTPAWQSAGGLFSMHYGEPTTAEGFIEIAPESMLISHRAQGSGGQSIEFSETGLLVSGKTEIDSGNTGIVASNESLEIRDDRPTTFDKGITYSDDYSANYGERSLVDKNYSDSNVGGQSVGSSVTSPTADNDGQVLAWDNASQSYILVPMTGGGGSLSNGSGTRVNGNGVDLGGTLTSDASISGNNKNFSISTITPPSVDGESNSNSISFKSESQNILNNSRILCSINDDGSGEVQSNAFMETSSLLSNFRSSVRVEQRRNQGFDQDTGEVIIGSYGSKANARIMCEGSMEGTDERQTATIGTYFQNSLKVGLINDIISFGNDFTGSCYFGTPDLRIRIETSGDAGSSTSEMTIIDEGIGRGILYGADYSANYEQRSLVDKEYVDSLIFALANENGLIIPN